MERSRPLNQGAGLHPRFKDPMPFRWPFLPMYSILHPGALHRNLCEVLFKQVS